MRKPCYCDSRRSGNDNILFTDRLSDAVVNSPAADVLESYVPLEVSGLCPCKPSTRSFVLGHSLGAKGTSNCGALRCGHRVDADHLTLRSRLHGAPRVRKGGTPSRTLDRRWREVRYRALRLRRGWTREGLKENIAHGA